MRKIQILVCLSLIILLVFSINIIGFASYNPSSAIYYADQWALSYNPAYAHYGSDCANFVSQCLHAGGFPYDTIQGWTANSYTWNNVQPLRGYLINSTDSYEVGAWGPSYQPSDNEELVYGDVIVYDWGQGSGWSHTSIVSAHGEDPDVPYYGWLVDVHTTSRYHAIWHLKPYNVDADTTLIECIRPLL